METGRGFETETPAFDLLFPAHDDRPREIGSESLSPAEAVRRLRASVPQLRLSCPGVGGEPEVAGYDYFRALMSARMGWSLSRRASLPLYASDRMAHMFGWGLAVLLDRRSGFERFYDEDEAAFYGDIDELVAQVRHHRSDDQATRALARRGWAKTWSLFDSGRVLDYLLAQLGTEGGASGYEWPCERWRG